MKITASVNYHVRKDEPQGFTFDVDGILGNLVHPELMAAQVEVNDQRQSNHQVNLDKDGISFVESPSSIRQFSGDGWQGEYNHEIELLLKQHIGAEEVMVFDHTVRIDAQTAERQPARNVHNDYSALAAQQRLLDLVGEARIDEFRQGRFAFVNVWRPIEAPITSSPLGFIRPESMAAQDWMNIELWYPDRSGQILGVAANPKHEWFYQSHMRPQEAVIFNVYDNQGRPYLAHSALDIVGQTASKPRKSIETRTLVRYA